MAPRGHKNVSLCRLSCPCYYSCGFPPPRYGRGGAEGIKTSARARFLTPRTANWFQRSSRVPTLLLMLWEGGWEWAGPSDSFELANLTPAPPTLFFSLGARANSGAVKDNGSRNLN